MAAIDALDDAPNAKAGLMFRESLAADAAMVTVLRDPSGRMYMVYRPTRGGVLTKAGVANAGQGPYAKLVRRGDVFRGYCSSDGKNWTVIADATVGMGEKIEMGMAVASHDPAALATATFSGFERIEPSSKKAPELEDVVDEE
ncbi:hypothetical protein [Pontiella sp.]|uniref:hypothetical protein n=1 Tax=Pontiella sp. TaxID=2837462 RepID=UPI00356A476E